MKKKILLSSAAVILVCLCVIAGSTFALFTTQETVDITVTAGELDITATVDSSSLGHRSLGETEFDDPDFDNGGSASIGTDGVLTIANMTPGDEIAFEITIANAGDIAVMYTVSWTNNGVATGEKDMFDALTITVTDEAGTVVSNPGPQETRKYHELGNTSKTLKVVVSFPNGTPGNETSGDNQYQGAVANINFLVEAVQKNGVRNDGTLILPTPAVEPTND